MTLFSLYKQNNNPKNFCSPEMMTNSKNATRAQNLFSKMALE